MEPGILRKRVSETRLKLAQLMTPNDANILGKVFGGSVLANIDLAASATAQRFSGFVCVTAAFERVDFHQPIEIGSLLELEGHISYAGRTSMEVTVDVYATLLPGGDRTHTNTARVTMVALKDGKPTQVPQLVCENRDELLHYLMGHLRRELRQKRLAEYADIEKRMQTMSDAELTELVEHTRQSREPILDRIG